LKRFAQSYDRGKPSINLFSLWVVSIPTAREPSGHWINSP
jgi:hypothetical protein